MATVISTLILPQIHFNISLPSIPRPIPIPLKMVSKQAFSKATLSCFKTNTHTETVSLAICLPTYLTAVPESAVLCKMLHSLWFTKTLSHLTDHNSSNSLYNTHITSYLPLSYFSTVSHPEYGDSMSVHTAGQILIHTAIKPSISVPPPPLPKVIISIIK